MYFCTAKYNTRIYELDYSFRCRTFRVRLFESGFAFCLGKMKEVSGTAWWLWGAGFLLCLIASMTLLAKAVQTIPIGTAYPIWTGIGAVCTVILGIIFLHEPATFLRLFFITSDSR